MPKPLRFLMVVGRLRLVNIFRLLVKQLASVFCQSFVVNHLRNILEMVRPNIFGERKRHHVNGNLLWHFLRLIFLIPR